MSHDFHISKYDYHLPLEQIAQYPVEDRDASRLLVLDRKTGTVSHERFSSILQFLSQGDCLVINNSKVFPARIKGRKATGGKIEFFLLHYPKVTGQRGRAKALSLYKSSKPVKAGQVFDICPGLEIKVSETLGNGHLLLDLSYKASIDEALKKAGKMPLPPYIKREPDTLDTERYQTVYASSTGSVAAPTAGLHFTKGLMEKAKRIGIRVASITLHVGYGTFAPIRGEDIRDHKIHSEWVEIDEEAAAAIQETRDAGRRVVAVGTTSVRSLEFVRQRCGKIKKFSGECDLYIVPGHRFLATDALITNFHLPRSSLLVLVCAFAGRKRILSAYREAVKKGYRFYSYGDAMLII